MNAANIKDEKTIPYNMHVENNILAKNVIELNEAQKCSNFKGNKILF